MFKQLESKPDRWKQSRRFKVWMAVSFAFILGGECGILARQLVTGPKPDWSLVGPQFALPLLFTFWFAVAAARKDS